MIDAVQAETFLRFSCSSCALCTGGTAQRLLFVTSLSVRFSEWMPAGPVTERLPGLDKITNCLIRQKEVGSDKQIGPRLHRSEHTNF